MNKNQSTDLLFEISAARRRRHATCRRATCRTSQLDPVARVRPRRDRRRCPSSARSTWSATTRNLSQRNMSHRHELLSARLVHDEVQPEAERAARRACRASPTCIRYQDEATLQGMLAMLYELQEYPRRDRRAARVSLQPAAGAQGELTALLVAAAYFRDRGAEAPRRCSSPTPPTAPTPPAHLAGFDTVTVKSDANGLRRPGRLQGEARRPDAAVFMITNPNTVGLFDPQIARRSPKLVHDARRPASTSTART